MSLGSTAHSDLICIMCICVYALWSAYAPAHFAAVLRKNQSNKDTLVCGASLRGSATSESLSTPANLGVVQLGDHYTGGVCAQDPGLQAIIYLFDLFFGLFFFASKQPGRSVWLPQTAPSSVNIAQ